MSELSKSDEIRLIEELNKSGLCKNLFILKCNNHWTNELGLPVNCPYQTDPGDSEYLKTKYRNGEISCPICEKSKLKECSNLKNFLLKRYFPLLISLKCAGKKLGTKLSGGIEREMCGELMGTDWSHNFEKKLRNGQLRCKCGSNRFVLTDRQTPQVELFLRLINEGRFPRLEKFIEENTITKQEVRKLIQDNFSEDSD